MIVLKDKKSQSTEYFLIVLSAKSEHTVRVEAEQMLDWMDENSEELSLKNMSYTLLIGRNHYEYRVAYVVATVEELKQKLKNTVDEIDVIKKVKRKNSSDASKEMTLKDAEESISMINELARKYLDGEEFDWKQLFEKKNVHRISLPGYPFERETYWINNESKNRTENVLHPLLDSNSSTLTTVSYQKELRREEFFLSDHKFGKEPVLPGVAYLEMARAACALAVGKKAVELRHVQYENSMKFEDGTDSTEIEIELLPVDHEPDLLHFEIREKNRVGNQALSVGYVSYQEKPEKEVQSMAKMMEGLTEKMTGAECYQKLRSYGLNLGETFQAIQTIRYNEDTAFAELKLPEKLQANAGEFLLHPSLLDGAMETVNCFVGKDDSSITLPLGVERLRIYRAIPETCYAYVTRAEAKNEKERAFNIDVLDKDGSLVVEVEGFLFRIQEEVPLEAAYFEKEWQLEEQVTSAEENAHNKVLYIGDNEITLRLLKANNSHTIVEVSDYGCSLPGNFKETSEEIKKWCSSLVEALCGNDARPDMVVVDFQNMQEDAYIEFLFHFVKAMYQHAWKEEWKLVALVEKTCKMQGLYAFFESIRQEHVKFSGSLVYVDAKSRQGDYITAEVASFENAEVKYENGKRYVKQLKEVVELDWEKGNVNIKAGDVILVTGGQGGISLSLMDYLKQKEARLVLIGRKPATDKLNEKLALYNDKEVLAEYRQCDITKPNEMQALHDYIKNHYGKPDGIFHTAGITNDSLIEDKSWEEMKQVYDVKVNGLQLLLNTFLDDSLKYVLVFSSISAIAGNRGQSDYAYANATMDALCAQYNGDASVRTKLFSINWTIWEDGGMHVDRETEKLYKEAKGIVQVSTDEAVAVIEKVLASKKQQVLYVKGRREKFLKALDLVKKEKNEHVTIEFNKENIRMDLFHLLQGDIAKILQFDERKIQIDDEWNKFGFNSITFADLSNEINQQLGTDVLPSYFFEYNNINEFLDYVLEEYPEQLNTYFAGTNVKKLEEVKVETVREEKLAQIQRKSYRQQVEETVQPVLLQPGQLLQPEQVENGDIAIIGMSGVMPQSDTLEEFWSNLEKNSDLITEVPEDRWDWKQYYSEDASKPNTTNAKWGGFMRQIDEFDNKFFSISPKEAELMDPQQRIFLETVYHTIEDAGYTPEELAKDEVGLFVGVSTIDYYDQMKENHVPLDAQLSTGISHCMLANRISYLFNFRGPSVPIDTACSSSLIAIHQAVESIKSGDCEVAIAGGVNVLASPMLFITFGKAGMLSKDGRCKTFDSSANGYVRGEGSGAIILKPLQKALQDHDHIYGLIKGTAVNHGGRANSITSPNAQAQKKVLEKAYRKAKIDPSTVTYIEAHGTGTKLGDPIEVDALKAAARDLYRENQVEIKEHVCGIGSVKTNIGHLETASGIAGVLKVLLSIQHEKIPGNPQLKNANPLIHLENSPFYLVEDTIPWKCLKDSNGVDIPRRAGVSSFGFGGANAHVVIEEYRHEEQDTMSAENKPNVIVLSARNQKILEQKIIDLKEYLERSKAKASDSEIVTAFAEVLRIPESDILQNEPLQDLGVDTVLFAQVLSKLNLSYQPEYDGNRTVSECIQNWMREKNSEEALNLDSIAYTLQVGREEMMARFAVVVSTVEELKEKLTEYVDGKNKMEGCFHTIDEVKNLEGTLDASRDNLQAIASHWIAGGSVNWNGIYKTTPMKCPLPVYPFEKSKRWFHKEKESERVIMKTPVENVVPDSIVTKEVLKTENPIPMQDTSVVSMEIIDGYIALIRMNDVENNNMFTNELIAGMEYQFEQIRQNQDIKVAIVTGTERVFSMGGTQEQLMGIAERKNRFTDIPFLYRGLLTADVPVISAISGHASGGGFLFGLYGDIVMLAKEAIYSASFMKYGFTPGMGATYILQKKLGMNNANKMMYSAAYLKGEELIENGAQVSFYDAKDVLNQAIRLARTFQDKSRTALHVLKKDLSGRILQELDAVLVSEVVMHDKTFTNDSVKEKIRKFYRVEEEDSKSTENKNIENKNTEKIVVKKRSDIEGQHTKANGSNQKTESIDELLRKIQSGELSPEDAMLL